MTDCRKLTAIVSVAIAAMFVFCSFGAATYSEGVAEDSPISSFGQESSDIQDTPLTDIISYILQISIPFFEKPEIGEGTETVSGTLVVSEDVYYESLFLENGTLVKLTGDSVLTVGTLIAEGDFTVENVDGGDGRIAVENSFVDAGMPVFTLLGSAMKSGFSIVTDGTVEFSASSSSTVKEHYSGETNELKLAFDSSIAVVKGSKLSIVKSIEDTNESTFYDSYYEGEKRSTNKTTIEQSMIGEESVTMPANGNKPVFSMSMNCDLTDFIKTSESLKSFSAYDIIEFILDAKGFPSIDLSVSVPSIGYEYDATTVFTNTVTYIVEDVVDDANTASYAYEQNIKANLNLKELSFGMNVGEDKNMSLSVGFAEASLDVDSDTRPSTDDSDATIGVRNNPSTMSVGNTILSLDYSNGRAIMKASIDSLKFETDDDQSIDRSNIYSDGPSYTIRTEHSTRIDMSVLGAELTADVTARGASEILSAIVSGNDDSDIDYAAILLDGTITYKLDSERAAYTNTYKYIDSEGSQENNSIDRNLELENSEFTFGVHSGTDKSIISYSIGSYSSDESTSYDDDKAADSVSVSGLYISLEADSEKLVQALTSDDLMVKIIKSMFNGSADTPTPTEDELKEMYSRILALALDRSGVHLAVDVGSFEYFNGTSIGSNPVTTDTGKSVSLSKDPRSNKALSMKVDVDTTVDSKSVNAVAKVNLSMSSGSKLTAGMYNMNDSYMNTFGVSIEGLSLSDSISMTIPLNDLNLLTPEYIMKNISEKCTVHGSGSFIVAYCMPDDGASLSDSPAVVNCISVDNASANGSPVALLYAYLNQLGDESAASITLGADELQISTGKVSDWMESYRDPSSMKALLTDANTFTASGITATMDPSTPSDVEVLCSYATYTYEGESKTFVPGTERKDVAVIFGNEMFVPYDADAKGIVVSLRTITVEEPKNTVDGDDHVTTVKVSLENSSNVQLTEDLLRNAISAIADADGNKVLEIVMMTDDGSSICISLSKESLNGLVAKGAGLSMSSIAGVVKVDGSALKTITGSSGENLTLILNILDESQIAAMVSDKLAEASKGGVVVSVENSADVHKLNGKMSVIVPYSKTTDKKVNVYYMNTETDRLEFVSDVVYSNGKISFSTDHMSMFCILEDDAEPPSSSDTEVNLLYIAIGAVIVIALIGGIVLVIRRH